MAGTTRTDSYLPYDIYRFINGLKYERCSLGGHEFWLNPTRYERVCSYIFKDVPTQSGVGRFQYGIQAITHTLEGMTGNAGLTELMNRTRGMGKLWPDATNTQQTPIPFKYPARGIKNASVYVNSSRDWMDGTMPNWYQYQLVLAEYPPAPPPYASVLASQAGPGRS